MRAAYSDGSSFAKLVFLLYSTMANTFVGGQGNWLISDNYFEYKICLKNNYGASEKLYNTNFKWYWHQAFRVV